MQSYSASSATLMGAKVTMPVMPHGWEPVGICLCLPARNILWMKNSSLKCFISPSVSSSLFPAPEHQWWPGIPSYRGWERCLQTAPPSGQSRGSTIAHQDSSGADLISVVTHDITSLALLRFHFVLPPPPPLHLSFSWTCLLNLQVFLLLSFPFSISISSVFRPFFFKCPCHFPLCKCFFSSFSIDVCPFVSFLFLLVCLFILSLTILVGWFRKGDIQRFPC